MSTDPMYLINDGIARMEHTPYDTEAELQTLIADFPQLLACGPLAHEPDLVLVRQEMPTPLSEDSSGGLSLDHLFIDAEALPTLVEVKQASDTRIRREVVGQMLDYAANGARYWTEDTLRSSFEQTWGARGMQPEQAYAELLGDRDPELFWREVRQNLRQGRMRLLFVADHIPDELRVIVEFLSGSLTGASFLAIELPRFRHDGGAAVLSPRAYGATPPKSVHRPAIENGKVDEYFWSALEKHGGPEQLRVVRDIATSWEAKGGDLWFTVAEGGASTMTFRAPTPDGHYAWPAWIGVNASHQVSTKVTVDLTSASQKRVLADDSVREELLSRMSTVAGTTLRTSGYPNFPLAELLDETALKEFKSAASWYRQVAGSVALGFDEGAPEG
ncbi:hypothetical protein AB0J38_05340 [Streptomyces sp. NPDC050095]|uniref:hypothetical protein n=1 Tax=unclassified Streptomyces TaxID=2593676 RepID=UPI0034277257